MAADRPRLPHVDQRVGNAAGAKQRNHAIGDVTLPDAVQRHRGTGHEVDPLGRERHAMLADTGQSCGQRRRRRTGRISVRPFEVGGVQVPQGLDGDVERPARQGMVSRALVHHPQQIERRVLQRALAVQPHQRGPGS